MHAVQRFQGHRLGRSGAIALMTALAPVGAAAQSTTPEWIDAIERHIGGLQNELRPAGRMPAYPSFQNRNRNPMPRSSVLRWRNPLANPASTVWYITPA
jgi:hypothetical protein